ncbi:heavy-metal-associated domain-containing protein [Arundinibacter roseus]|uniref:Heavy-metal-associated domain-containing protein n=1 Tax=Arundinibacter roseus TaxID=2070510 RepID=A0A4R4K4F1_9BACT|nr:heavy-metal-associated domain-containing protein [Arundinibacter roseus]TDB62314.1 heavy-metal-associated domain-containing protein [Arundinibacter roseus]
MKTIILSIFFSFALTAGFAQSEKEVKIKTSAICEMCKERLERNLGLSKGVKEANLNLDDKVMTIKYNPKKTDLASIKSIITNTGYDADEAPADQKSHDKLPACCRKTAAPHSDGKH